MIQDQVIAPAQSYDFATAQEMNDMAAAEDAMGYVVDGDGTTVMRSRSPGDKRG